MKMSNLKKSEQLGMPQGTASNRLRKMIMFNLIKQLGQNRCHQCGEEIEAHEQLSVEHKVPYLDSVDPIKLFFDLDNIAYSHLDCNVAASRRNTRGIHPSRHFYRKGCRCQGCKDAHAVSNLAWRKKKKSAIA